MRQTFVLIVFLISIQLPAQTSISDNGHPEHIIIGTVIGAGTSYLVFRKTDNKLVSWLIGAATATTIGYFKEAVDPKWFNGQRSKKDFLYTALGGVIGTSIVIPLKRKKPKKIPNIDAAFNQPTSTLEQLNEHYN